MAANLLVHFCGLDSIFMERKGIRMMKALALVSD